MIKPSSKERMERLRKEAVDILLLPDVQADDGVEHSMYFVNQILTKILNRLDAE